MARDIKPSPIWDGASRVNVNEEMDNVEVRWMFEPGPGPHTAMVEVNGSFKEVRGTHSIKVLVRSTRFEHSKMIGELPMTDVSSDPKMVRNIGILAGALAEEVNERFGDDMTPDEVARAAIEAFKEMQSEQKNALLQDTH